MQSHCLKPQMYVVLIEGLGLGRCSLDYNTSTTTLTPPHLFFLAVELNCAASQPETVNSTHLVLTLTMCFPLDRKQTEQGPEALPEPALPEVLARPRAAADHPR